MMPSLLNGDKNSNPNYFTIIEINARNPCLDPLYKPEELKEE